MNDPSSTSGNKEREGTDAKLVAERAKTDNQLIQKRTSAEAEEDQVVKLAEERAEKVLADAREHADAATVAGGGRTVTAWAEVRRERAASDQAVAHERVVAEEDLREEREQHALSLAALLRFEREATDDGLLVERLRADESVATRDDFLAIVSHDLRGILGIIAMSASLLATRADEDGEAGADTKRHVHRIQRSTARMNRLVGDLLDVVSLEAGKLSLSPRLHDAALLVREASTEFMTVFAAKQVTLIVQAPPEPIFATLDHDRVVQILANLLSNALKFTAAGGSVVVSCAVVGFEIQISVTDTGIGVPVEHLETIFERFGQVKRGHGGHGLGLYIARCIVQAHGGRIWAARPDEGGTALHFTLPLGDANGQA